jgi:hypothetical protein
LGILQPGVAQLGGFHYKRLSAIARLRLINPRMPRDSQVRRATTIAGRPGRAGCPVWCQLQIGLSADCIRSCCAGVVMLVSNRLKCAVSVVAITHRRM